MLCLLAEKKRFRACSAFIIIFTMRHVVAKEWSTFIYFFFLKKKDGNRVTVNNQLCHLQISFYTISTEHLDVEDIQLVLKYKRTVLYNTRFVDMNVNKCQVKKICCLNFLFPIYILMTIYTVYEMCHSCFYSVNPNFLVRNHNSKNDMKPKTVVSGITCSQVYYINVL